MLVVVATEANGAAEVRRRLGKAGAASVDERSPGRGRILVHGGPFDDRQALAVAAELRAHGWPADVRPEGGGHLAAWQAHTSAVYAGRLMVCFPWSESDRGQADVLVEIDPAQAFGTGSHPTTRLLLKELATRIQGGERVLDVGCGSGVLAIAAASLGAREVTATDILRKAVEATKANATRNQVEDKVQATSTPVEGIEGDYDVIVANIEAPTLIALAPHLIPRLRSRGWLALSGLSPAQISKVEAAYRPLKTEVQLQEDDWSALIMAR